MLLLGFIQHITILDVSCSIGEGHSGCCGNKLSVILERIKVEEELRKVLRCKREVM